MAEPTIRCPKCAAEFTDEQVEGKQACPTCGNAGIPHAIADDVTLRINWSELRILTIWATWWSETAHFKADDKTGSANTLKAIIRRLQDQHPEKPALTFAGELQEMANTTGSRVEEHRGGEVTIVEPRKPN